MRSFPVDVKGKSEHCLLVSPRPPKKRVSSGGSDVRRNQTGSRARGGGGGKAVAARDSYHHGNLRRALIDAALEAIAEVGPERFTLRDVARRAGVSPGAPYKHFPDKDALLAAVSAEAAQRLGETMDAAVAAAPADPAERYRKVGLAYVRFAVEHPAHFRAMHMPGVAAKLPPEVRKEVDAWIGGERDRLAEAQRRGEISSMPLDAILLASHCLVHGLARLIVDREEGFTDITVPHALALAEAITGVFGVGLLPRRDADC